VTVKKPKTRAAAIHEGMRQLRRLCVLRPTIQNFLENVFRIARGRSIERLVLRNGMTLCGPVNHPLLQMAEEIFHAKLYMPDGWSLEAGSVVVDIGANIGIFSVLAAERQRCRVFAFEPHPENIRFLRQNVSANRMANVTVCESAVSDLSGWQRLYVNTNPAGHSLYATSAVDGGPDDVRVPTTTLPEIMDTNHLDRVDFLKIDCEGSEGAILLSTPADYLKRIGRLAIEFHDNVSAIAHERIQALLEQHGFRTALRWDAATPFGFLYARQNGVARDAHSG
jgi:FkbM family methyltransferase